MKINLANSRSHRFLLISHLGPGPSFDTRLASGKTCSKQADRDNQVEGQALQNRQQSTESASRVSNGNVE